MKINLPKQVILREVGPREGFQTLDKTVPTAQKLELISLLSRSGVSSIEVAAFVRADRVPQMADAEQIAAGLEKRPGVKYTALYLNHKGFERAEATGKFDNEGWLYTAPSESFLRHNNNCTIQDTITGISSWLQTFAGAGKKLRGLMISTAFGCNYEGKISAPAVASIAARFVAELKQQGETLQEICLADTVGLGNPLMVRETISAVREAANGAEISLHLHDTRGTGIANAFAALESGVTIFEASVGGMGGCPFAKGASGNIASEDFLYLCRQIGVETGIDLDIYIEAARLAARITGLSLPGRVHKLNSL